MANILGGAKPDIFKNYRPRLQKHQNSTKGTARERRKNENCDGRGKKRAEIWAIWRREVRGREGGLGWGPTVCPNPRVLGSGLHQVFWSFGFRGFVFFWVEKIWQKHLKKLNLAKVGFSRRGWGGKISRSLPLLPQFSFFLPWEEGYRCCKHHQNSSGGWSDGGRKREKKKNKNGVQVWSSKKVGLSLKKFLAQVGPK